MIIQGSNAPIIFNFNEAMDGILDIEIHLYDVDENELKHWTLSDVTIEGKQISAPLTQVETMDFPVGRCTIEVKWMDANGKTNFAKDLKNNIIGRVDKTIMEGAD